MAGRYLGRAALTLAGLLAAAGIAEGGVRWLRPQPLGPEPGTEPELVRGQFTRPGDHPLQTAEYAVTVHVNAAGFVDREWLPEKNPAQRRVMLIGDSFVQAAQVPLEAGIGRVLDGALPGAEVESLGVPGAGTATALLLLERYMEARRPDAVVLGFLVSNDVLNNHPLLEGKEDKPFFALVGGDLVRTDSVTQAGLQSPLWRWSALWRYVARAEAVRAAQAQKLALGGGMPVDLRVHDPARSPVWEEAWAVTGALIARMAEVCAGRGVRFGVLLFPDGIQATAGGRQRAVTKWPQAAGWDFSQAQRRAAAVAGASAPVLDLLPALQGQEGAYLIQDGHWTAEGHRLAGEGAAGFVAGLITDL